MKKAIQELGSLCKMAAELERKWDLLGKNYLETRTTSAEYTEIVREYLTSVRRLEAALSDHLVSVTEEVARRNVLKPNHDEHAHRNPAS